MKIYVKLLFARIQSLQNELEGYKKWENTLNTEGLLGLFSSKLDRNSGTKFTDLNRKTTLKSTKTLQKTSKSSVGGLVAVKASPVNVPIHPSIDPQELEQLLVELYFTLPSPSPNLIVKLLEALNAPLSKINPDDLLNSVKHERSKELLQKPITKLLDQVSKREIYLEARISHLEKVLGSGGKVRDRSTDLVIAKDRSTDLVIARDRSTDLVKATTRAMSKDTGKLQALKILQQTYIKLQDLEWKQDTVSSYLKNLEKDLQAAIQSLKVSLD
jgi:hypothetical protein